MTSPAETLIDTARAAGARIATAESCTGGMIAAAITDIPGASDVFEGGFVAYSNIAKEEMLWVGQPTLDAHGAVSEDVAREMAEGALSRSRATITVAVTGIAGPGGSEFKPEGHVCFAIARKDMDPWTESVEFGEIGRDAVRRATVDHAIKLLTEALS
ncbi:nicotinamide-nucleotide amidase [Tranquillimonas rosea]|uniref:Nicotinamide-nucleotide amidase n=1 Tax=Tranquillimonas rosea TaxID=641238 RepID=A0A1H9P789_9RHOB|nr:CinA family protein [Tranquillimonas rosea]SER43957.1 nicotinamide-nucleotide amidase [Tranquillimonas rosea]